MTPNSIPLFPSLNISSSTSFPPTLFLHGTKDTAVHLSESLHFAGVLKEAGVWNKVVEVEGEEHGFDTVYEGAEEFDAGGECMRFLEEFL